MKSLISKNARLSLSKWVNARRKYSPFFIIVLKIASAIASSVPAVIIVFPSSSVTEEPSGSTIVKLPFVIT